VGSTKDVLFNIYSKVCNALCLWKIVKPPREVGYFLVIGYCVAPENIHTPPMEGIGNSWGVGVLKGQKIQVDV